jgi:hypothetical protein
VSVTFNRTHCVVVRIVYVSNDTVSAVYFESVSVRDRLRRLRKEAVVAS